MSWNQAGGKGAEEAPEKKARLGRWLATTGIMIAVLAGGVVWFWSEGKTADKTERKSWKQRGIELLTRGQGEAAPKVEAPAPVQEAPKRKLEFWEMPASETNNFTEAQMRKWTAMHLPPSGYTNDTSLTEAQPEYAIFNTAAENEIACLLMMEPGDTIVDVPNYSEQFKREFYEGLKEPIEITEEDSEYQAELKRMMMDARAEMKRQIDAGADLGEILTEAREELLELARYKSMLSFQLGEIQNDATMTDQDLEDFVNAANEMLESKGIAPMELGYIAKMRLKRLAEEKKMEEDR